MSELTLAFVLYSGDSYLPVVPGIQVIRQLEEES